MSSEKEAFNAQRKFSKLYQEVVIPELEKLFSSLVNPDQILRIPKLEIDLGFIEEGKEDKQFVEKCLASIGEEIRKQLYLAKEGGGGGATLISKEVSVLEQLEYFFQYGRMKWNLPPNTWNDFEFDVLSALEKSISRWKPRIQAVLKKQAVCRGRLLGQFSVHFIQHFLALLFKAENPWIERLLPQLEKLRKAELPSFFKAAYYEWLLEELLFGENTSASTPSAPLLVFIKKIHQRVGREKTLEFFIQLSTVSQDIPSMPTWSSKSQVIQQVEKLKPKSTSTTPASENKEEEKNVGLPNKKEAWGQEDLENKEMTQEGFMVGNAGLVILIPFLKTLFQALDLLEKDQFKNTAAQHRAVLLTQYLVTGAEETPEYELTLNKFICGMPLNVPLDKFKTLSVVEKEEAQELLKAVIKHWKALGDVSLESLQEGFLQRSGKLYLDGSKWRLLVERKTIDILVDRLPWTYTMSKLPWMKDLLNVEW